MLFTECPRNPGERGGCKCPTSEPWCRKMTYLGSNEFGWSGPLGTAEASDLGYRAGTLPSEIYIRSTKTGETVRFDKNWTEARAGDVLYTEFKSARPGVNAAVRIYND